MSWKSLILEVPLPVFTSIFLFIPFIQSLLYMDATNTKYGFIAKLLEFSIVGTISQG